MCRQKTAGKFLLSLNIHEKNISNFVKYSEKPHKFCLTSQKNSANFVKYNGKKLQIS